MPDHAPQIPGKWGVDDDPATPDDSLGASVENDDPAAYIPRDNEEGDDG